MADSNKKLGPRSMPDEVSELEWLKVQEELERIDKMREPFVEKAIRLTKENPFVPLGLY
jgi:hypothetical protein